MKTRFFRRLAHSIISGFLYFVYVVATTGIFASLAYHLQTQQYKTLAVVSASVVAALFGFTSLLYNRSRSHDAGAIRARTLYAAERAFAACVEFVLGTAIGAVAALLASSIPYVGNLQARPVVNVLAGILFIVAALMALWAFASLFVALKAVTSKLYRVPQPYRYFRARSRNVPSRR